MKDCVIFDVDGTLADLSHRLHYIKREKRDYDTFNSSVMDDIPIDDIVFLSDLIVTAYHENNEFDIFICSGRPEDFRHLTEAWLQIHTPRLYNAAKEILLRPSKDYRKDDIIKNEMRQYIENQGYNIRFVVDDRPSIVKMWRDNYITCLQVADWKEPVVNPGALHLMVGPSCGGKSTLAAKLFPHDQIISSDGLRKQLTGSIKDMSKDSLMWPCLHKITQARLEAGADTVIDATNLKNHDRRELRNLQFPNGKIIYHVINQPLKQKKLHAGWREGINVKGKSLIEYHEDVFNSNLEDILSGDNDNRVEVIDHRFYQGNGKLVEII